MLRVFRHYVSGRKLAFFVAESVLFAACGALGAFGLGSVRLSGTTDTFPDQSAALVVPSVLAGVLATLLVQLSLYLFDLYDFRVAADDRSKGVRALRAMGAALILGAMAAAASRAAIPSGLLLGSAAGAVSGVAVSRLLLRRWLASPERVLVVGSGPSAHEVVALLENEGEGIFQVLPLVGSDDELLAKDCRTLLSFARDRHADHVVLVEGTVQVSGEALFRCRIAGIPVCSAVAFCERVLRRLPVSQLQVQELAFSDDLTQSRPRLVLKRAFDVFAASLLLVLASPAMLLVALLIKLDSRGPVFYRQERVGVDGRGYRLWKFRSMGTDAEKHGAVWARTNDDRVTRIGRFIRKTRIDEIPQVFNVLMGDMSFVGPRPERPVFVETLKQEVPHYALREAVKPGITGWAQIRYPYGASVEDARNKLEYDLYYVKNGSLFLDVAIMFHTVRHVLFGKGAR